MKRIVQRLFQGSRRIGLEDLRKALEEVEKDRRRNRREVLRWERKRKQLIERMKRSRAAGDDLEVDYLWDEFKEHRRAGTELRREGRAYNVEGIALRRYAHAMERLDRKKDRASSRRLLERIRASGLHERLAIDRESELRYLEEVNQILEEFEERPAAEPEDPEKALFLAELDGIRRAEDAGDAALAEDREQELIEHFDPDGEEAAP